MEWKPLLTEAHEGHHIAQVYQNEIFLIDAITVFIREGLRAKQSVIIIATKSHWNSFAENLGKNHIDFTRAIAEKQLIVMDAEEILAQLLINNNIEKDVFKRTLDPVIERSTQGPYSKVRVYGEVVDLLWKKGNLPAAIQLEGLWNDLMKTRSFSLFCSYTMDGLDKDINRGPLPEVCKTHSHFIPTPDYGKFERALNEGIEKILGSSLSNMLKTMAVTDKRVSTQMPPAQTLLLWLTQNMPVAADKILSYTRQHLNSVQKA